VGAVNNPATVTPASYHGVTVADFQAVAGSGTATSPANINDNTTTTLTTWDAVGEYVEIKFADVYKILRWRQWGHVGNNGSGRFSIQYYDLINEVWADLVTGIPTHTLAGWTSFTTETTTPTDKVRIVATTLDTGGLPSNRTTQWEIIF